MRLLYYIAALILLSPVVVFASDGHGPTISSLLWRIFIFAIFFAIMWKLLKNRVRDGLAGSIDSIKKAIADAEKACADAEAELADYSRKMASMGEELEKMRISARNTAEKEVELMMIEADKTAEKFKQLSKDMIRTEIIKARLDIRREVALIAVEEAEKMLAADTDTAAKQKYIADNIIKIGA